MTSLDLTGRTAIITGASRGIGLAIAQQLAAAGAHVVLTARRQEAADEAAAQVGDRALGVGAHAVDEDAARRCVDLTLERFGSVDILINNAGTNPAYGPLLEQDHARFAKIFDVNLWAPLMWTSLVVTAWMGEHGGAVVNTASIGGMHQSPAMGMYNATKAALIHVTKQLALELSPRIRVNAICPGVAQSRRWANDQERKARRVAAVCVVPETESKNPANLEHHQPPVGNGAGEYGVRRAAASRRRHFGPVGGAATTRCPGRTAAVSRGHDGKPATNPTDPAVAGLGARCAPVDSRTRGRNREPGCAVQRAAD